MHNFIWIPVTQDLPDPKKVTKTAAVIEVMVIRVKDWVTSPRKPKVMVQFAKYFKGKFYNDNSLQKPIIVTHWQYKPLPNAYTASNQAA